jgi:Zn finger protein HypA/HybF involved in hydrogenase expression
MVGVRWECPRCAAAPAEGQPLRCPRCGGRVQLAAGDEIVLDRIEMEVH